MIDVFLSVILPTFLVAGMAAGLERWKKIPVAALGQLSLYLLTPALLFTSIIGQQIPASTSLRLAAATVAVTALTLGLARGLSRLLDHDRSMQSAFQLATAFPNSGNMGLPVLLLAFGQRGLDIGIIVFLTQTFLGQSLGIFVAARGGMVSRAAVSQVFRMPALWAALAAIAIRAAGVTVPFLVAKPIALLSQAAIPIMMVVLGFQIAAGIRVERVGSLMTAVCVRLLVGGAIAYGVGIAMGLHGMALAVLVVICAMPAMVYSIVLATEFDVFPTFVASAVIVSTVCSMLTLTGLITYLKRYVVGG